MTARRPPPAAANNTPATGTSNAAATATTPAKNNNLRPRSTRVQRSSGSAASECVRLAARRFSFLVGGNRRVRPVSSARRRRENRRLGASAAKTAAKQQQQQQVQVRPAPSSPLSASATTTTTTNNNNVATATTTTSNSINVSAQTSSPSSPSRREISESFEIWALKTYGDSAKTKTVTRRKYIRISRILRGEEQNSAENSKFRFWVKAKGFRLGPPPTTATPPDTPSSSSCPDTIPTPHRTGGGGDSSPDPVLYVPCAQTKGGDDNEDTVYKKVAVVENFFDIIYNVHVEMDGRGGKHAGQKRTYKAIAETYAFLPREAVTKFLMQCSDCQKRMHAAGSSGGTGTGGQVPSSAGTTPATVTNGTASPVPSVSPSPPLQEVALQTPLPSPHPTPGSTCNNGHPVSPSASSGSSSPSSLCADPPQIDFSLPITTTYLKHMRSLGYTEEDALNPEREDCTSNADSESSSGEGPTPIGDSDVPSSPHTPTIKEEVDKMRTASFSSPTVSHFASEHSYDRPVNMTKGQPQELSPVPWPSTAPINMSKNGVARSLQDHTYDESVVSPCMNGVVRGQVHSHLVNREATSTPEDLSGGTKDEDDDDDDDNDEKLDSNKYDPERLKAFNMFVRLFVDENLDRMVPISKQPKEKIQAIIDSCNRQFPEFAERARKRIRTYLKSCRRTKRTRDQNGWDLVRPTPPHLTSAMAEQILASACENESNNAKRMRLGMDPLSAAIQTGQGNEPNDKENLQGGAGVVRMDTMDCAVRLHSPPVVTSTASPATAPLPRISPQLNGSLVSATSATPFHATSVTSQQAAQPTAAAAALPTSGSGHSNGPTDLTVKKSCPSGGTTKCSLNPTEVLAVKQLVAGYRESAAFLIRSADELEQLLLQQN